MPAPDALDTLRRHDPAAALPPAEADARERLHRAIVAEPVRSRPEKRPRRRGRLVLVAAAVALVLSAAAWSLYSGSLDTPETVSREFDDATKSIPLPPGETWDEPYLPDGLYGQRAALMAALAQAECAWLRYWDEGDAAQRSEALVGIRKLRTLMPLHPQGAPEEVGGYDESSLRATDRMIAEAARGDGRTVRQHLLANC